jgi:hypothetical protein
MKLLVIAIVAGLTAALIPIALRLLSSTTNEGTAGVAMYSKRARTIALVSALLPPIALSLICALQSMRPDEWVSVAGMLLLFALVTVPLLLEFFRVKQQYDDRGLDSQSPWSSRRQLTWENVGRVRWRPLLKWLDLHPADGSKPIHISPMLTGLEGLAAAALAGISKEALAHDPSARGVLLMMRHGRAARLVLDPGPDAATVAELEALSTRDANTA